jgi:DNA-binding SARP family transcriptional activator/predicted ATPase
MAHLFIHVLGDLRVLKDDVLISSFESDKVRALLAYLVVEAGSPHRREALIGLLWPDCPESAARHNLSQALFNLRRVLGDRNTRPPYLLISRDAIQFNQESSYTLDLDQFNRGYLNWQKCWDRESEGSSTQAQREETVQLYRGEFLHQFSLEDSAEYEDWILTQREALHQRVMRVLTCLANDAEQHGNYQTARQYTTRQLELDPWREEAHCQMMRLLALDGQRSAALAQYETCRRVLADELSVEPSPQTRELVEQIRAGKLAVSDGTSPKPMNVPLPNLPVSSTPFIGREQELIDLARLITDPVCRCITLVGPGGIGKTRLALQAAEQHSNEFIHGAAWISLASAGSIEAAITAIAAGTGIAFYGPADPKGQLLKSLHDKQILLVLDNAEHLLADGPVRGTIAGLMMEILANAPEVKLLVTSRETVQLQEEWLFEVRGLAFPAGEQADRLDEFDAVTLFIQRARRSRPDWVVNEADKTGIMTLCQLVEGMPLAIELAASWVKLLSPVEIAVEIGRSLDILNTHLRDIPDRHRSMRAVFDHSWQVLSPEEKRGLSRLTVFRGGFTRQAAEQVAGAKLPVLASLLSRSLIRRTSAGRYDLHELVRQYAASKLAESPPDLEMAQKQHSLYYLAWLQGKGAELHSTDQKRALAELSAEIDNIRAAWDWSTTRGNVLPMVGATNALWYFYELRSWFTEGEEVTGRTAEAIQALHVEKQDAALQRAFMHTMRALCGSFKFRQGRSEEAYQLLSPSVAYLRTTSNTTAAICSLAYIGITCWELGRFAEAKEYLQECRALARENGEHWYEAMTNEFLGILAHDEGEYQPAQQLLNDAMKAFRQIGDPSMTAHVLSYLARTYLVLGEYREAEKLLREGLDLTRAMDYRFGAGLTLDALGQIASMQEHLEEAAGFFSESARLFRDMGDSHRLSRTLNHLGMTLLSLGQVTEARNTLMTGLRLAHEGGLTPSAINALTGLAAIDASREPDRDTLKLVTFILQQTSSNSEAQVLASQLLTELGSKFTPEEIKAADAKARTEKLGDIVLRMLANA